jgi:NAD(P)-dependent dehydrogenase (short-subunit alcohol dehydrogenase family)
MNIIIIGATSGIGKALYEKYAADVNYRTEETPGEDANVKNSHAYEY